jgi:TPR repeat protein
MKQYFIGIIFLAFSVSALSNEGMSAFNRKDYNEAYRLLSQDPDKPESLYGIGRIVLEGLGAAPKNVEKGLNQITRAAESGYRPAIVFLSEFHEKNGNIASAIRFYKKLSDGKTPELEQKILHLQAKLTKGDPTNSAAYCETLSKITDANQKKDESALCSLRGHQSQLNKEDSRKIIISAASDSFSKKEYDQAVKFWNVIPELPESMFGLSKILLEGLGSTKKDVQKSKDHLQKAADIGFSPASLALAQTYESEGKIDAAVAYYQKFSAGRDTEIEKKITQLLLQKNKNNSDSLTKESCEIYVRAATGGDSEAKLFANICAYQSLINDPTKNQAFQYLKDQLSKNTNKAEKVLITIGPELLNESSKNYDPEFFENIITRTENIAAKSKLSEIINGAKITYSKCSELPTYSEAQKKRFLSICSLAAYGGDIQASIALAELYSSGNSDITNRDLEKAKSYLSQSDQVKENSRLALIKLNISSGEKDWKTNLNQIEEFLKQYLKDSSKLRTSFDMQIEVLNAFKVSGYKAESAQRLGTAIILSGDLELLKKAYPSLSQINQEKLNPLEDMDSEDRKKLREIVSQIKQKIPENELKAAIDSKKSNDERRANQSQEKSKQPPAADTLKNKSINTTQSSESIESSKRQNPTNNSVEPEILSNAEQYSELKLECDKGQPSACHKAGKLLLRKNPPSDYVNTPLNARRNIARQVFQKGVDKQDEMSMAFLYDLLSEMLLDEKDLKYRMQLLDNLVAMDSAAGHLRNYALVIDPPTNFLNKLTTAVLKVGQVRSSCEGIRKLLEKSRINTYDINYANKLITNIKCKTSDALQ